MSNRGRHRKKNKKIRINLQELINFYWSKASELQAKIENLSYEQRKT